jgi:hypothetical protein
MRKIPIIALVFGCLALSGCGDPTATFDGRKLTSTQIDAAIDSKVQAAAAAADAAAKKAAADIAAATQAAQDA